MHFVYLFRDGPDEELRYSIRSVDTHFKVDSLTIVGDKPNWLEGVNHIGPAKHQKTRYGRVRRNLHEALPDCPDRFVLMNDDFFAMRNTRIPNWHRGRILTFKRPSANSRGSWKATLAHTAWLLREWGFPKPLNYGIHAPMKVDRDDMLTVLDSVAETGIEALSTRTVYGNVAKVGGTKHEDVVFRVEPWCEDGPGWASTTDHWWNEGKIGDQVREMYPDPSPFER